MQPDNREAIFDDCPMTIEVGRRGATEEFAPFVWTWTSRADITSPENRPRVGAAVRCYLSSEARAYFGIVTGNPDMGRGFVTDVQLGFVIEGNQPVGILRWTATGRLARAGQVLVGDEPWPAETVRTRIGRIGAALEDAFPLSPTQWLIDADNAEETMVIAKDVDRRPALELLTEHAEWAGGMMYEGRRYLTYRRQASRADRDPLVELSAREIVATANWESSLSGIINDYTVTYGESDPKASVRVIDQASIDAFGVYAATLDSDLATEDAARNMAAITVGRNSFPRWRISELNLDVLKSLPVEKAAALLLPDIGDLIHVTGIPATAPATEYLFVEGWSINVERDRWDLAIYVTDGGQTGAPIRWVDLPVDLTWADVPADMSWLQTAGWFAPPTDTWRWSDVPADQDWADLGTDPRNEDHDPRVPTWASYPENP